MGLRFKDVKNDRQLKSVTGLDFKEFNQLVLHFQEAYLRRKTASLEDKLNLPFPPVFTTYEDLLFFVLYRQKTALSYQALGLTFGIASSSAENNYKDGSKILSFALKLAGSLPENAISTLKKSQ